MNKAIIFVIIAIAFVLLIPISSYANVQVNGTTISGLSEGSTVNITIYDSDGIVFSETVEVDETLKIELPRLYHGDYTLSLKHGAIGGVQEVVEFTYTGPEPETESTETESTETESLPEWVRGIFVFWANDEISDDELKRAIKFLVENGIIEIDN